MNRLVRLLRPLRGLAMTVGILIAACTYPAFAVMPPPQTNRSTVPQAAPPKIYVPPDADRVVLSNGVVAYLYENHELPLFDMNIHFKASPADEVPEFSFELFDPVWRTGGTKTIRPDDFDDRLESMATSIGTGADNDGVSISVSCLSRDLDASLDLWTDLMLNPAFDERKLAIAKGEAVEGLRRKNETPNQVGRRAFRDVIYGPNHPYASDPLPPDLTRITRANLIAIHKRVVAPQTAIIAVAGDFDKKALIADLERRFAKWPRNQRTVPSYDYSVSSGAAGRVFLVEKDFSQSRVAIGRLGISHLSPERYACEVADYILGGGGPSRLFGEIRSRRGLAYMVGSFVQEPVGPGMIGVISQTRAEATVAVIDAILAEMKRFSSEPVTPEELELAKASMINANVFNYDLPFKIASAHANIEFFGYDPDELKKKPKKILAVTREDVLAMGKKYYNPADAKIVVVGDPKKFDGPLDKFGKVEKIPLDSIR
jgi:zinc protease